MTEQVVDTRAPVKHPARFNEPILAVIERELRAASMAGLWDITGMVLDPFAGVGGIHRLGRHGQFRTFGIELEPEWAAMGDELGPMWCGDFFDWEPDCKIGAVVTSCTYANRMADHHTVGAADTSKRMTYKHALGRDLSDNNSGAMGWGTQYRAFHIRAWIKVRHLLAGGGVFVLNVKDHVRGGEVVPVAAWHKRRVLATGDFREVADVKVPVRGMGFGANGQVRVDHERVLVFERVRDESRWNAEGEARREAKRDAGAVRHGA